jgi:hypothetical protein
MNNAGYAKLQSVSKMEIWVLNPQGAKMLSSRLTPAEFVTG